MGVSVHQGHRQRLRERFLREGIDAFADHQVLELLLFHVLSRVDTNPVAHRLLDRFGSLAAVLEADPADLADVPGVGPNAAAFLALIPQVSRRYLHVRANRQRPQLSSSEAVERYVVPLMAGRPEEVFWVLCLDAQCRLIHAKVVAEGTVTAARVEPRHVVECAVRHRAASVVLAHNHPQGTAKPSDDDRRITQLLSDALTPIGIRVLDHLVVAGDAAFSFAREGVLPGSQKAPRHP
jgi:DNA repair protein RadC